MSQILQINLSNMFLFCFQLSDSIDQATQTASSSSTYDKINVVQADSTSGPRYKVNVARVVKCQKVSENRHVFIEAWNDAKVGATCDVVS